MTSPAPEPSVGNNDTNLNTSTTTSNNNNNAISKTNNNSNNETADWAIRLDQEKRMTQQLAAKNEALNSQQHFVVERAADFALQQQQRIAELETQLGAAAPGGTEHQQQQQQDRRTPSGSGGGGVINVRHGCPRCSTCTTLLQTVAQLEQMLQNRDSDVDMLRKSLDDSQRVNALLLEQIDLLQRGLEKAISNRVIPQNFQGSAPQSPLHPSVSPQPAHHYQQQNNNTINSSSSVGAESSPSVGGYQNQNQQQQQHSFNSSALPTNVRMLQPSSEPTLRAMADAVQSLQNLWLGVGGPSPSKSQPPAVPANKLSVAEENNSNTSNSNNVAVEEQKQQQQPKASSFSPDPEDL